jgi:predicted GIY-YIG superfamily endonuclease
MRKLKWDKELCEKAALSCTYVNEFSDKFSGAYKSAKKFGWYEEITSHLILKKKQNNYWTFNLCQLEAKKYKTRTEFFKTSRSAYKSALKNNWLDDITKHMEILGSQFLRYNYVYEFSDNTVYIGITYNIKVRHNQHMSNNGSVKNHINKTNLTPKLIHDELKQLGEAISKEKEMINTYKRNGWVVLNKNSGGSAGSNKNVISLNECINEAIKYKDRVSFKNGSRKYYNCALKNNWLEKVCSHMKQKWNRENCIMEAKKYKTKKEFYTNSQNAYRYALRCGFLSELF